MDTKLLKGIAPLLIIFIFNTNCYCQVIPNLKTNTKDNIDSIEYVPGQYLPNFKNYLYLVNNGRLNYRSSKDILIIFSYKKIKEIQLFDIDFYYKRHFVKKVKLKKNKKKELLNLIKKIEWNNYNIFYKNNYNCVLKKEDYLKKELSLDAMDGYNVSAYFRQQDVFRSIGFYEWEEFCKICNDEQHFLVLKLMNYFKGY